MRQAFCSRDEDGHIQRNSSGEKVVVLREWAFLLGPQRVASRRQSTGRADWEKLPWTGHLCFLFTRAWEIGRLRSYYKKERKINLVRGILDECRCYHTDWVRGAGEPLGWDEKFDINRDQWPEQLGRGVLPGDPTDWGGGETEDGTIYIYIDSTQECKRKTYICVYIYVHEKLHMYIHTLGGVGWLRGCRLSWVPTPPQRTPPNLAPT